MGLSTGTCAGVGSQTLVLERVGKYLIREEIGHGGMATVYRARDTVLERDVALKILHPHLRGTEEARIRFAREARSVAKLRHPNVLEVYDYAGEDADESYIAAELLTGPTLKDFVALAPPMPAEIAACFGIALADALSAAHAQGIIHRDVKPENALLHERRTIKLTDFGIAQVVDSQFTVTGQILGSPGHMAPEQLEGVECDARTDVFSLGTLLYYCAVGRLPFTGKNPHHILRKIMEVDFPDPLRARPAIGERMRKILVRAMAKRPDDRYATAGDFAAELRAFVRALGIDDPDVMLRKYLGDPPAVTEEIDARIVEMSIREGKAAASRGDVPGAQAAYNRALALDESNAEVLALVQRLGEAVNSKKRWLWVSAAGALLVTIALVASSIDGRVEPRTVRVEPDRRATAPRTPRTPVTAIRTPLIVDAAVPPRSVGAPRDASVRLTGERPDREEPSAVRAPRPVTFRPDPPNVSIAIDDGAPVPFGPSFRTTSLAPGRHRIRFVPGTDCCDEAAFNIDVPPGTTPFVVARTLAYRPSRLYVVTDTPADVVVFPPSGGPIRGRSREFLTIPLGATEGQVRLLVTADGRADYTGQVRLRAGALTERDITLGPPPVP